MINRWDTAKIVKNRKIATVYPAFCQVRAKRQAFKQLKLKSQKENRKNPPKNPADF